MKLKKEADSPLRRRCRSYYYQNHVTQEFNDRINSILFDFTHTKINTHVYINKP